jgi:hypothetical protein
MKRYDIKVDQGSYSSDVSMEECEEGEYVLYEDYEELRELLEKVIEDTEKLLGSVEGLL